MIEDYAAIERRVMASHELVLRLAKAAKDGLDVHRLRASEVFGVEYDAVTDEQRRRAKAMNYETLYGIENTTDLGGGQQWRWKHS